MIYYKITTKLNNFHCPILENIIEVINPFNVYFVEDLLESLYSPSASLTLTESESDASQKVEEVKKSY